MPLDPHRMVSACIANLPPNGIGQIGTMPILLRPVMKSTNFQVVSVAPVYPRNPLSYIPLEFEERAVGTTADHAMNKVVSATGLVLIAQLAQAGSAAASDQAAFANDFQLRISSFYIESADTDIAVFDDSGIGTIVNFADDLGGDESKTIPRLDMHYRFSNRHRLDFASYRIERNGRKVLQIDIDWDDQNYSIGETISTRFVYELVKIGYAFSFYHSPEAELSFTAGFNITSYDFEYELADGSRSDSSDVSAPLPMLGLRMSYAITPKWSAHYLTETFFVEIGDELKGSFFNYEFGLQYRAGRKLLLGLGIARLGIDLESEDEDWSGSITDTHRGFLVYLGFQL